MGYGFGDETIAPVDTINVNTELASQYDLDDYNNEAGDHFGGWMNDSKIYNLHQVFLR